MKLALVLAVAWPLAVVGQAPHNSPKFLSHESLNRTSQPAQPESEEESRWLSEVASKLISKVLRQTNLPQQNSGEPLVLLEGPMDLSALEEAAEGEDIIEEEFVIIQPVGSQAMRGGSQWRFRKMFDD